MAPWELFRSLLSRTARNSDPNERKNHGRMRFVSTCVEMSRQLPAVMSHPTSICYNHLEGAFVTQPEAVYQLFHGPNNRVDNIDQK